MLPLAETACGLPTALVCLKLNRTQMLCGDGDWPFPIGSKPAQKGRRQIPARHGALVNVAVPPEVHGPNTCQLAHPGAAGDSDTPTRLPKQCLCSTSLPVGVYLFSLNIKFHSVTQAVAHGLRKPSPSVLREQHVLFATQLVPLESFASGSLNLEVGGHHGCSYAMDISLYGYIPLK